MHNHLPIPLPDMMYDASVDMNIDPRGSSFFKAIGAAYQYADSVNRAKLYSAFRLEFHKYLYQRSGIRGAFTSALKDKQFFNWFSSTYEYDVNDLSLDQMRYILDDYIQPDQRGDNPF